MHETLCDEASNHLLLRVYEVLLDSLQVHSHSSRISHFERPGKIVIHTKKKLAKVCT